ncbi:MAG: hypothetical protein KJZ70_10430 [Bryobacterales bacterium]|nr:hypothetical protein [Bryobacterales bacterium]
MAGFNPKYFAQPDLLKTIAPKVLIHLLEPSRRFLEERGLLLPREDASEIDYLALGRILAKPDEFMNASVIEGLHVIANLGRDEHFDDLLDIARRNFIDVDLNGTAADLAARIWIERPQALMTKERVAGSTRRRKYDTFRARDPENVVAPSALPRDLSPLEAEFELRYQAKGRGVGCHVVRCDLEKEIQFFVVHGQLCKREPCRNGRESGTAYFRPEKTDLVVYDFVNNELRINTGSIWELKLFLGLFSKHLFGASDKFIYMQKYTLEPLRRDGVGALRCRDVGGIDAIQLTELEMAFPGGYDATDKWRATDVFAALAQRGRGIDSDARIISARFAVKIAGGRTPRPVRIVPPNVAEYARGEEAAIIERFFRMRGFVVKGDTNEGQSTLPFMAVA